MLKAFFSNILFLFLLYLLLPINLLYAAAEIPQKIITSQKSNTTVSYNSIDELERQYVQDTHKTIEKAVNNLLGNLRTLTELNNILNNIEGSWKIWSSSLFHVDSDADIDAYGNLYSLQVMCKTLVLAAEDAYRLTPSVKTELLVTRANVLYKKCEALSQPVVAILRHHANNPFLDFRMEIMQRELPFVEFFYNVHPFHSDLL